jgi:tRNA-dihydrouridine synthase
MSAQKIGKREYLDDVETRHFTSKLKEYFESSENEEAIRDRIRRKGDISNIINKALEEHFKKRNSH